jgi:hypothetical protein
MLHHLQQTLMKNLTSNRRNKKEERGAYVQLRTNMLSEMAHCFECNKKDYVAASLKTRRVLASSSAYALHHHLR